MVGSGAAAHFSTGETVLFGITTLPAARHHGVATALFQRRIEDARAVGSTVIFNTGLVGDYAAGFYARLGLVPLFTTRTFVLRDEADVASAAESPRTPARA